MQLQELFETATKIAHALFEHDHEVLPMWHIVKDDGTHALIPTPWASDDEKDRTIDALRDIFKKEHVQRYAFICEAWSVLASDRRQAQDVIDKRPSQHPDRREVLRVTAEERNGKTLSGMYYILRPEHGPPKLSPFHQDPPDLETSGRLTGLFVEYGK